MTALRRMVAVAAVLAVAGGAAFLLARGGGETAPSGPVRRSVDLVAVVESMTVDSGWTTGTPRTTAAARLNLDDLRTLSVAEGTLFSSDDEGTCTDLVTPGACVLLADMLGDAVVWFALVGANTATPASTLEVPGLVDMQAAGDEGVLPNGWVLPLATPTRRVCKGTPTKNLREFITKFPGHLARSTVDLTGDRIVAVECLD